MSSELVLRALRSIDDIDDLAPNADGPMEKRKLKSKLGLNKKAAVTSKIEEYKSEAAVDHLHRNLKLMAYDMKLRKMDPTMRQLKKHHKKSLAETSKDIQRKQKRRKKNKSVFTKEDFQRWADTLPGRRRKKT